MHLGFGRRLAFAFGQDVPIEARPVTVTYTQVPAGILLTLFALFWSGVVLALGLPLLAEPGLAPTVGLLFFIVIGVGFLAFGIHLILYLREVTIGEAEVAVATRGLTGRRHWREPLRAYDGVIEEEIRYRRNKQTRTAHCVVLSHAERARCQVLAARRDRDGVRGLLEDYARWLDLPALTADGETLVAREAADLDKPVAALVREGAIALDWDPEAPPPDDMAVEYGEQTITVTLKRGTFHWAVLVPMLSVPAIFVWLGLAGDLSLVVGLFGVVVAGALLASFVWDHAMTRHLIIRRDGVGTGRTGPFGSPSQGPLPAGEIESVRVGRDRNRRRALLIETDRRVLVTGEGYGDEALAWLRDLILAALVTAGEHTGSRR